MTSMLAFFLNCYAQLYLWRFRPVIVGVTGNAGKTTTKEAIAAVLATKFRVRATGGNLNNELGMPLTILGDFSERYYREGGTLRFWFWVLFWIKLGFFRPRSSYPEVLVLEYGADHPGDIKKLARRYRPTVAVVTAVGEIPVHVEFFASAKHLAEEKSALIKAVVSDGLAVLNGDDQTVLDMRSVSTAPVESFGFGQGASAQVSDMHVRLANERPQGVAFNVSSEGASMPVFIRGAIGRGVALASAAAVLVGQHFNIGLAQSAEALSRLVPPAGRLRLLEGIKGAVLIDDTYNSSPAAVHVALDALREISGRKVAVLGDMLELGEHSVQAHQAIGTLAATVVSELVCVGERARFIADAAGDQLGAEHIHWFATSKEAAPAVQNILKLGDVVLVKGSQGMRMERIAQEIMAEPQRAGELLVRQSARWKQK